MDNHGFSVGDKVRWADKRKDRSHEEFNILGWDNFNVFLTPITIDKDGTIICADWNEIELVDKNAVKGMSEE